MKLIRLHHAAIHGTLLRLSKADRNMSGLCSIQPALFVVLLVSCIALSTLVSEAHATLTEKEIQERLRMLEKIDPLQYQRDLKLLGQPLPEDEFAIWSSQVFDDAVYAIDFSPDGNLIAAGAKYDGTIKLVDAATGQLRHSLVGGHTGSVFAISFTPDGKGIFSGGANGELFYWDIETQKATALFGHHGSVVSLKVSLSGHALISLGGRKSNKNEQIILWNIASRSVEHSVSLPKVPKSFAPALSHHSVASYVGLEDGRVDYTLFLVNVKNGEHIAAFENILELPYPPVFSHDGKTLVVSSVGAVKFLDLESGEIRMVSLQEANYEKHALIARFALSTDGDKLATISVLGEAKVWNIRTTNGMISCRCEATDVAFSPNNKQLVVGSKNGILTLFRLEP